MHKPIFALFVITLFVFLLPFIQVSCNNKEVVSFTGLDLAMGPRVPSGDFLGNGKERRANPEPTAIAALAAGLVGLMSAFATARIRKVLSGVAGSAGVICLLLLKQAVQRQAASQAVGLVFELKFQTGYWLAILSFGAAAIWQFVGLRETSMRSGPAFEPPRPSG